jgi:hypothetical protein
MAFSLQISVIAKTFLKPISVKILKKGFTLRDFYIIRLFQASEWYEPGVKLSPEDQLIPT